MIKHRRTIETAFQEAKLPADFSAHSALNNDLTPYAYEFFRCQNDMTVVLARKIGFDVSKITIQFPQNVSEDQQLNISKVFQLISKTTLRKTDQVFHVCMNSAEINIILPGTCKAKAEKVIHKIQDALKQMEEEAIATRECSFSVEALHECEHVAA